MDDFHLILVMQNHHRKGLPKEKTYTLKEYAGLEGDIPDPYGNGLEVYQYCRDEIRHCLNRIIEKNSQ